MTSVEAEAAASLFGSVDSVSDPFAAVLGSGEVENGTPANYDSLDHGASPGEVPANGADLSSLFGPNVASSSENSYTYDSWLSQADDHHDTHAADSTYANGNVDTAEVNGAQGWYGQNGQGYDYEQPQASHSDYDGSNKYQAAERVIPSAAHQSYDASPSYSAKQSAAPPTSRYSTVSTYDVLPATSQTDYSYNTSTSTPATPLRSAYDPYQTTSSSYNQYNPSTSSTNQYHPSLGAAHNSYSSAVSRNVPPPPPPAPKSEPYRPKKMNAYDPPLPAVRPKQRTIPPPVSSSHEQRPDLQLNRGPLSSSAAQQYPSTPNSRGFDTGLNGASMGIHGHNIESSKQMNISKPPDSSHMIYGHSNGVVHTEVGTRQSLSPSYLIDPVSYAPLDRVSSDPYLAHAVQEDLPVDQPEALAALEGQSPFRTNFDETGLDQDPEDIIGLSSSVVHLSQSSSNNGPHERYQDGPSTVFLEDTSGGSHQLLQHVHASERIAQSGVMSPPRWSGSPRESPVSNRSNVPPVPASTHPDLYSPPPFKDPYKPGPTSQRSSLDTSAPGSSRAASPSTSINSGFLPSSDPYKPNGSTGWAGVDRVASPGSLSVHSWTGSQDAYGDYTSPSQSHMTAGHSEVGEPFMSHDSTNKSHPAVDPYASSWKMKREASEISDYGDQWSSYIYPGQAGPSNVPPQPSASEYDTGQDVYLNAPARAAYAPSPTLLGSNDPLGRVAARVPLISFGFGGKMLTCFHGSSTLSTGFDVALSSRVSTDVSIRLLHKVVPESDLDMLGPSYPGPLFSDPGTPTSTSLVRTNASYVKAKKARVIKYLDERQEEFGSGVGYLTDGSVERRRAEGKLLLVKLLKIMVENDGRLSGSEQIDSAVRSALIPRLEMSSSEDSYGSPSDLSSMGYLGLASDTVETPVASYAVKPSALDKIQNFLLRGERRKACHCALDEKLWAHALLISSSIDKDTWKEVVHEFLRTELGRKDEGNAALSGLNAQPTIANGRPSLRVAYSLFAGEGAASVQELVPSKSLSKTTDSLSLPVPAAHTMSTPMSPNFSKPIVSPNVPDDVLSSWSETAAMILSNPLTADASAALTTLGDYLVGNHWVEAGHACYLLSPQTSIMGGVGSPSVRVVLLGCQSPHISLGFSKDADHTIFSEIVEFAMSLTPHVKGQEPFAGLPHLQAYRLVRAVALAEFGHVQLAARYCEAIRNSMPRNSSYFNVTLMHKLKELSDRLVGAPHLDKSGSWIGGRMNKPSLDSIGNWLEGRLTKFIAGDGDASPPHTGVVPGQSRQEKSGFDGPFTHYSAISSAVPSQSPSPQPSLHGVGFAPPSPPRRSGSAVALRPVGSQNVQIDRASSAMDYTRSSAPKSSSAPRIASADAATTTFAQAPSFGQAMSGYSHMNSNQNASQFSNGSASTENNSDGQDAPWWNSYSDTATPTATTFSRVDDDTAGSTSSDFISLMDDSATPIAPRSFAHAINQPRIEDDGDVEDLGFRNSSKRSQDAGGNADEKVGQTAATESTNGHGSETNKAAPAKPPLTSAASGSWLSRLWKRDATTPTPAPVKANLGNETSFYYDKELKRWVNKKSDGETTPAKIPPPPPSRAQTASPSRSAAGLTPPPARPASAVDLSISPPKRPPMRVRSNLVPDSTESAPNSPAAHGSLNPPPPPSRPRSQMAKKSVRSRYVDVFQSPDGS